jgi:hypothetical protein
MSELGRGRELVRVLGVLLAAVPGALWAWTVQVTGTGPVMISDQAEQWTAAELRKLRRHGWRVVNHFLLRNDDIDHVLTGPGGAYLGRLPQARRRRGRLSSLPCDG